LGGQARKKKIRNAQKEISSKKEVIVPNAIDETRKSKNTMPSQAAIHHKTKRKPSTKTEKRRASEYKSGGQNGGEGSPGRKNPLEAGPKEKTNSEPRQEPGTTRELKKGYPATHVEPRIIPS